MIAEIMTSPDRPVDETAPVLGWERHGWAPIHITRQMFDNDQELTTYCGRFRTVLRKSTPLTRDPQGYLEFENVQRQEAVGQRTELFYRIVNAHQAKVERLAPVDVDFIEYYDPF